MPPLPDNDTDIYLVIEDFGANGRSFLETDLTQADRDTTVRNFISGQYESTAALDEVRTFPHLPAGALRGLIGSTASTV